MRTFFPQTIQSAHANGRFAALRSALLDAVLLAAALVAVAGTGLIDGRGLGVLLVLLGIGLGARSLLARARSNRLARAFVSPAVADLLARHGEAAMHNDITRDVTVVCADIRNYTAFTAGRAPEQVMQFLREYYEAAGQVVRAHGAVIKDYAGDGILVLVGATEALDDHAERAVRLADDLRAAALAVTARWSANDNTVELGVGIGMASGVVALGMLGGTERVEFAAVGDAVNLAARLCGTATSGQIVLSAATQAHIAAHSASANTAQAAQVSLKGFSAPQTRFVLEGTLAPAA